MHDIIVCSDPFPIPEGLRFLQTNWSLEPFKTNCLSKKFDQYKIYKKKLYKNINGEYKQIQYDGFLTFYTHFFDDPPKKQIYVSYIAEFKSGKLIYILINEFKEYDVQKESIKANYFLTLFNLFKNYIKK
jgi:hypothetical protein